MRPILFNLGPIPVRAYGTLIIIGFLVGVFRAMRLCTRRMETEPEGSPRRIHPDAIFDLGIVGLLVGLMGARILFVLLDWGSFAAHPLEAFKFWEGGLSLHGGLLFGILYMVWFCRWKRLSLLAVGDVCAPAWAIGYAIGRIGCLLNGCCYGSACSLPWAIRFHDEHNPELMTPPSHPIQLYATLFNIIFFLILIRWEKRPHRDGELFFGYIGMYGFYRYVVEIFRAGATSTYLIPSLHLTDTHLISIIMVGISLLGIGWLRRHRPAVQDIAEVRPQAVMSPNA